MKKIDIAAGRVIGQIVKNKLMNAGYDVSESGSTLIVRDGEKYTKFIFGSATTIFFGVEKQLDGRNLTMESLNKSSTFFYDIAKCQKEDIAKRLEAYADKALFFMERAQKSIVQTDIEHLKDVRSFSKARTFLKQIENLGWVISPEITKLAGEETSFVVTATRNGVETLLKMRDDLCFLYCSEGDKLLTYGNDAVLYMNGIKGSNALNKSVFVRMVEMCNEKSLELRASLRKTGFDFDVSIDTAHLIEDSEGISFDVKVEIVSKKRTASTLTERSKYFFFEPAATEDDVLSSVGAYLDKLMDMQVTEISLHQLAETKVERDRLANILISVDAGFLIPALPDESFLGMYSTHKFEGWGYHKYFENLVNVSYEHRSIDGPHLDSGNLVFSQGDEKAVGINGFKKMIETQEKLREIENISRRFGG